MSTVHIAYLISSQLMSVNGLRVGDVADATTTIGGRTMRYLSLGSPRIVSLVS